MRKVELRRGNGRDKDDVDGRGYERDGIEGEDGSEDVKDCRDEYEDGIWERPHGVRWDRRAGDNTASEYELEFTCKRCVASSEYVRDEVCGMGVGQSPPMKDTALEATGSHRAAVADHRTDNALRDAELGRQG